MLSILNFQKIHNAPENATLSHFAVPTNTSCAVPICLLCLIAHVNTSYRMLTGYHASRNLMTIRDVHMNNYTVLTANVSVGVICNYCTNPTLTLAPAGSVITNVM